MPETTNSPLPRAPARMTTGFAFSFVERCIKESFASRRFGHKEMALIVDELFGGVPECVFCGSPEVRRWDHLFPVAHGGDTLVGNMVPACSRCDDSKQDLPYREWMLSSAKFSPKTRGVPGLDVRLERIEAYVARHSYVPKPVEERLSPSEADQLREIRFRTLALMADLEGLIQEFRLRTGDE